MTKTTYKVGDKVRILNANKIVFGSSKWNDGDITTVASLTKRSNEPRLVITQGKHKGESFVVCADEFKYIEKVAEQVVKFKVGDKVRIISTFGEPLEGFSDGEVVEVIDRYVNDSGERRYCVENLVGTNCGYGGDGTFELIYAKPTQSKSKTKARISELERKVAELAAKVEALESAKIPTKNSAKIRADFTPNEERKAVIDEAKAFVAKHLTPNTWSREWNARGAIRYGVYGVIPEFHVNKKKRTVTLLLKGAGKLDGKIKGKYIAKCAEGDVFNADIGKAIVLGRALGKDVKRFEQAAQPTEVVVGQTVRGTVQGFTNYITDVTEMFPKKDGTFGKAFKHSKQCGWIGEKQVTIIDDTEAVY